MLCNREGRSEPVTLLPVLAERGWGGGLPPKAVVEGLKLALHQRGEEALMRGAEVGEGDACDRHILTIHP